VSARTLVHQGFLYSSPDEFTAALAPLVQDALERGDAVFAAARRPCVETLREELDAAARVELHDTEAWYPRPFDRLMAVDRMVRQLPHGRQLLAFGEPVWSGSDAVVREWARYESVINTALADAPLRFVCLYDAATLSAEIVDHGRHTHSELLEDGVPCACETFVAPEDYVPALRAAAVDLPVDELPLGADQHAFRAALAAQAHAHGLGIERAAQLVLAANEVATNAPLHGWPPAHARVWAMAGELVCEIEDSGLGIADPLAGWRLPDPAAGRGWGLAVSRQLCDALEIVSVEGGARVRLHMALDE
jgi:anti-sigma regulatory factor (Ser/Thr protein kinase)